jgi:hypothetical protein
MNIQSKDINQIIELGLEQYSCKKKIQDYINKTTRTCFINEEVSPSTLVEDLTSHG